MLHKPHAKRLRHIINILSNRASSEITDETWIAEFATYAEIQPFCDNKFGMLENLHFDHVITEALFLFKIRFNEIITNKMRINFKHRIFEIKRIINLSEQDRWLQIIALEIL